MFSYPGTHEMGVSELSDQHAGTGMRLSIFVMTLTVLIKFPGFLLDS